MIQKFSLALFLYLGVALGIHECRPASLPLEKLTSNHHWQNKIAAAGQYKVSGPTSRINMSSNAAAWALPNRSQTAIAIAYARLILKSACGGKNDKAFKWRLACPEHARWVGVEMAAIAESVRRHRYHRDSLFCKSHYVEIDYDGWIENSSTTLLDTPGSSLLKVSHAVNRIRHYLPDARILSFRLPMKYFGETWYSSLFGDIFEGSCLNEIKNVCGTVRRFKPVATLESTCTAPTKPAAQRGPVISTAGFWLPVREIKRLKIPKTDGHDLWPTPLTCSTVASFRDQYGQTRRLIPIEPLFEVDTKHVINVVIHMRAGKGSRSPPEEAYLPLMDAICRAVKISDSRRSCHIYIVTEGLDGSLMIFDEIAATQRNGSSAKPFSFTVVYNVNRYVMWHSLWMADVVVSGFSTYSLLAGVLSPHPKVVIAGLDMITGGYLSQLGPCPKILRRFPLSWTPCLMEKNPLTSANYFHDLHVKPKCAAEVKKPYFIGSMIVTRRFNPDDSKRKAPDYQVYRSKQPFRGTTNCTFEVGVDLLDLQAALS